ncbi:hypothetical protein P7C70_g527, partial [Phenoliferia sp. Uapishka_3]
MSSQQFQMFPQLKLVSNQIRALYSLPPQTHPFSSMFEQGSRNGGAPDRAHRDLRRIVSEFHDLINLEGFARWTMPMSGFAGSCTFRISARPQHFPVGPKNPTAFDGWKIPVNQFSPNHSHPPPYEPLDLHEENRRRLNPLPIDYTPPLIPRRALATFLLSIDSSLSEYVSNFEPTGMLEEGISLEDIVGVECKEFKEEYLDKVDGLPPLVRCEILKGFQMAKDRYEKGEEVDGRLGDDMKEVTDWLDRKFGPGAVAG